MVSTGSILTSIEENFDNNQKQKVGFKVHDDGKSPVILEIKSEAYPMLAIERDEDDEVLVTLV